MVVSRFSFRVSSQVLKILLPGTLFAYPALSNPQSTTKNIFLTHFTWGQNRLFLGHLFLVDFQSFLACIFGLPSNFSLSLEYSGSWHLTDPRCTIPSPIWRYKFPTPFSDHFMTGQNRLFSQKLFLSFCLMNVFSCPSGYKQGSNKRISLLPSQFNHI